LRILLMPAPPLEVLTLLVGPDLPPRVGALLLFVVGAGAIVENCVVDWRKVWLERSILGCGNLGKSQMELFDVRPRLPAPQVAVRERDALESTSSKRK
jgi:hypothetical protein